MLSRDYTFWLHGWSEINGGAAPSDQQWQIILDHLALVNREAARLPSLAEISGQLIKPLTPRIMPLAYSGISGGLIGVDGQSTSYAEILARDNAGKVFITVSREPLYDLTARYSYYPYIQSYWDGRGNVIDFSTRAFLTGHGVQPVGDKVYVVIDNSLYPSTGTYARNMYASSPHHLHGLHPSAPGIINIGTDSPAYC